MVEQSTGLFGSAVRRLGEKTVWYWIVAVAVLLLAHVGSPGVYEKLGLHDVRSEFFQAVLDRGPRPAQPRRIKLLEIRDDEYWLGPLAGRRPIKRDYLANLVDKLVAMNVHVIALDIDARLPNPKSFDIPEDYKAETERLIDAIRNAVRSGKKVVLASAISYSESGAYHRDSDIYQANGLCSSAERPDDLSNSKITCGYIALPFDPLSMPSPIDLDDQKTLDPFGLAIARAADRELPEEISRLLQKKESLGYLNFITHARFAKANAIFSANEIRSGKINRDDLDSKIVIVGGSWSRDAAGRGPHIDAHSTPVGQIDGLELHANYAEAILDSRVYGAVSEKWLHTAEIGFGVFAALALAVLSHFLARALVFCILIGLALAISAVALPMFGIFFDAMVPLVGLGIHALTEPYVEFFEKMPHHVGAATAYIGKRFHRL